MSPWWQAGYVFGAVLLYVGLVALLEATLVPWERKLTKRDWRAREDAAHRFSRMLRGEDDE